MHLLLATPSDNNRSPRYMEKALAAITSRVCITIPFRCSVSQRGILRRSHRSELSAMFRRGSCRIVEPRRARSGRVGAATRNCYDTVTGLRQIVPQPFLKRIMPLQIFVDADACPVKEEAIRVATRYGLPITLVSNQAMRTFVGPNVTQVAVGTGFDAADDWIVERADAGDIVITSDILLAARCLEKSCRALNSTGAFFDADNIGSALAMRELNAYLREAGEIKGYNASFSKKDRSQFLQSLDLLIQKAK